MSNLIITIDGPAGVGKSTVARLLAQQLGIAFLDTGAMYRAVTLAAMQKKTDLADKNKLLEVLQQTDFQFRILQNQMKVSADGVDVTEQIRNQTVTANVRHIAEAPELRAELVKMQRSFAREHKRIVTEGRDQGTVAFADADFKFYLTADLTERARRRQKQLAENGKNPNLEKIQAEIVQRDASDRNRVVGPLTPAPGAIIIDTTDLDAESVVEKMLEYIEGK
ncbi:MAG: (d)CMP kinase [Planctomycetota bacterium]|nr:MAG: (d)CMP kinase [Planctomycetota bacterium]